MLIRLKKERNPDIFTICINLEDITLSEIRQTQKDNYHMISHLYVD